MKQNIDNSKTRDETRPKTRHAAVIATKFQTQDGGGGGAGILTQAEIRHEIRCLQDIAKLMSCALVDVQNHLYCPSKASSKRFA